MNEVKKEPVKEAVKDKVVTVITGESGGFWYVGYGHVQCPWTVHEDLSHNVKKWDSLLY